MAQLASRPSPTVMWSADRRIRAAARRMRLAAAALVLVVLGLGAAGCGGGDGLAVYAAISLRRPLEEMAAAFETAHPGTDIRFTFDGSQRLRFQLEQGGEADVFVSADARQIELTEEAGLVSGGPTIFAGNRLVVVTPSGNPAGIVAVEDLASPGLRLIRADDAVPLGGYTNEVIEALGAEFGSNFAQSAEANVVSREANAEAVAGKIDLGEADAAIVYETDARRLAAGGATVIPIPDAYQPEVGYLAAVLAAAGDVGLARDFVEFLLSEDGQRILIEHGFLGVR